MTDNRDSGPGSDGTGSGGVVPPPFPDAAPPAVAAPPAPPPTPLPAPPPTPYPAAPARSAPWGWIVAAILAVALITLVCLHFFTSLLDKAPRDSWQDGGGSSSFSQSGSGSGSGALGSSGATGSGQGTYAPPPPPPTTGTNTNPVSGYAPTAGWLQGTWGPGCPGSSAQAVILYGDGRIVVQGSEGTWTLNGYVVTLNINGRTFLTRWEYLSQDMARVTQVANGQAETVRRCL